MPVKIFDYAEFYPQGLKDYNRARLGQLPALLDRFITAADKHKATLGPELLAEFNALKTSFATARDGQVEAKGDLAQVRAALAAARVILEMQLGKNILAIASHHLGHPERAADYFNQSLLEDPTRNDEDGVTPPPAGRSEASPCVRKELSRHFSIVTAWVRSPLFSFTVLV